MADDANNAPPEPQSGLARHGLPYVPGLDGVRAIAIVGVLLYHGQVASFPGGFLGVDVFLVLSGFLITSLLLSEVERSSRIDLKQFWFRRARRLLPAAFTVVIVALLVVAIFMPSQLDRARGDALGAFFYVSNWHQILGDQSYFASLGRPPLLQHLWSLAVEEQFYLFWPLLLGLGLNRLGKRRTMIATTAMAVGSAIGMALLYHEGGDPSRIYYGTDTHASGLLVGALLAFVWPLRQRRATIEPRAARVLDGLGVLALVLIVLAMVGWHDFDPVVYRGGLFGFAFPVALLLFVVTHPAAHIGKVLGVAPMRWIGTRSYGIYLWHWPVMAMTRPQLDLRWSLWVLVPLQIALACGLAEVSYRWIEQPFRQRRAIPAIKAWLDGRAPRRRLAICAAALLLVLATSGWVALRSTPAPADVGLTKARTGAAALTPVLTPGELRSRPGTAVRKRYKKSLAVGASVMLGAAHALGPRTLVDAAVGRYPKDIIARLQAYQAADQLPKRVIVQMGENGPVFDSDIKALRKALRGVPTVVLVNVRVPRSWNQEVNDKIASAAHDWPEAHLADWYDASAAPGLLYDDGIHPTVEGEKVYAKVINRAPVTDP